MENFDVFLIAVFLSASFGGFFWLGVRYIGRKYQEHYSRQVELQLKTDQAYFAKLQNIEEDLRDLYDMVSDIEVSVRILEDRHVIRMPMTLQEIPAQIQQKRGPGRPPKVKTPGV